jgi:hypothetical protein
MAQLQAADVRKIKCIFFQNVRDIVEAEWYGLKCNIDDKVCAIEQAKLILEANDIICDTDDNTVACLARDFIKKYYNLCKITLAACEQRTFVEENIG